MNFYFPHAARQLGVPEDRTRDQFTAEIEYHDVQGGRQILAHVRANTLTELQALVADFAWENTPA